MELISSHTVLLGAGDDGLRFSHLYTMINSTVGK